MVYFHHGEPAARHLLNVSKETALKLWFAFAEERFEDIERQPWEPGNGYILTPERKAEIGESILRMDRQFYDVLGPEDSERPCAHPGCPRRSIRVGVFCRPHHFESIQGKPCPFDD
jgi:hypothetical protein